MGNGEVALEYDWYGFVKGGVSTIFIVFSLILLFTYLISFGIFKLSKDKK